LPSLARVILTFSNRIFSMGLSGKPSRKAAATRALSAVTFVIFMFRIHGVVSVTGLGLRSDRAAISSGLAPH
jgi:hypothetical protein